MVLGSHRVGVTQHPFGLHQRVFDTYPCCRLMLIDQGRAAFLLWFIVGHSLTIRLVSRAIMRAC